MQLLLKLVILFACLASRKALSQYILLSCDSESAMAICHSMLAAFCCLSIFCVMSMLSHFCDNPVSRFFANITLKKKIRINPCRFVDNRCRKQKRKRRRKHPAFRKRTFWLMMLIFLLQLHHAFARVSIQPFHSVSILRTSLCYAYSMQKPVFPEVWCLSRKQRNKRKHAANGNGGKFGSKGAGGKGAQPTPEEVEAAFHRSVLESMPQAARQRFQPQLIADEWSTTTTSSTELSHKGGIAICYKAEVPEILRRVGYTMEPTAILLAQDPASLGLRAYPSERLSCNIKISAKTTVRNRSSRLTDTCVN